jgi:hypothetical protein
MHITPPCDLKPFLRHSTHTHHAEVRLDGVNRVAEERCRAAVVQLGPGEREGGQARHGLLRELLEVGVADERRHHGQLGAEERGGLRTRLELRDESVVGLEHTPVGGTVRETQREARWERR